MTESDEIAASIAKRFDTFDAALAHVRKLMPGESETVMSNVAEALVRRPAREAPRLHPDSWRDLRQLVKLHGANAIRDAVDAIAIERAITSKDS
jgi:hypothetical protein